MHHYECQEPPEWSLLCQISCFSPRQPVVIMQAYNLITCSSVKYKIKRHGILKSHLKHVIKNKRSTMHDYQWEVQWNRSYTWGYQQMRDQHAGIWYAASDSDDRRQTLFEDHGELRQHRVAQTQDQPSTFVTRHTTNTSQLQMYYQRQCHATMR